MADRLCVSLMAYNINEFEQPGKVRERKRLCDCGCHYPRPTVFQIALVMFRRDVENIIFRNLMRAQDYSITTLDRSSAALLAVMFAKCVFLRNGVRPDMH